VLIAGEQNSHFALARFKADGTVDPGSGTSGVVETNIPGISGEQAHSITSSTSEEQRSLAIAPNGKIAIAGRANLNGNPRQFAVAVLKADGTYDTGFAGIGTGYDYVVIRLKTDGSLDGGFGTGGVVHTNFATLSGDTIFDLEIMTSAAGAQYLDRIVVAGDTSVSGAFQLSAARYLTTGALDTSYDGDGKVLVDVSGQTDEQALGMTIEQSTGRVVLVTP
jgi:uncharacterized delta-60 repeat protein